MSKSHTCSAPPEGSMLAMSPGHLELHLSRGRRALKLKEN